MENAEKFEISPSLEMKSVGLRVGYAFITGHHGELVQGVFEHNGELERALVTLPCHLFHTRAVFYPDCSGNITVYPKDKSKALKAAKIVLNRYADDQVTGSLQLFSNAPMSIGVGSSTLDTISSILAVSRAIGQELTIEEVNMIGIEAETASDPLLYQHAVLFAQRKGFAIRNYERGLPSFHVLGFNTDSQGVDTLTMSLPVYTTSEVRRFAEIQKLVENGINEVDHQKIADAATTSARINQKYLAKSNLEKVIDIVRTNGGLGVQVSHSGTVIGCLFPPGVKDRSPIEKSAALISELGYKDLYEFIS